MITYSSKAAVSLPRRMAWEPSLLPPTRRRPAAPRGPATPRDPIAYAAALEVLG